MAIDPKRLVTEVQAKNEGRQSEVQLKFSFLLCTKQKQRIVRNFSLKPFYHKTKFYVKSLVDEIIKWFNDKSTNGE